MNFKIKNLNFPVIYYNTYYQVIENQLQFCQYIQILL
ncbi:unnamed protein product [Paramecium sonneborni]|uniref:Uncharacterized protein n=1 Tax=Paramecium sonneborni TaxID=65129 RepID=A0A8S1QCY6_9CILI|nr:unnamed protein product [Paramecium sonneborni]